MDVQKFREVLKKLDETEIEYDYGIEMCWKGEVEILSEDIPSTIEYLQNQCTEDEFFWISEIIDDLAAKTQSRKIVECYKNLGKKYPDVAKTFNFASCVKYAEATLGEDTDV